MKKSFSKQDSKKVLIIIDMQSVLVTGAYREEEVLDLLRNFINRARAENVPIIYVQHNHASFKPMMQGEPGWQIHPAIAPLENDLIIEKEASDAFYQTELATELQALGVKTLLLAGMQSEFCVDATARSALSHDFNVILLSDCHTTGDSGLSAEQIIEHHNKVLPGVAHPTKKISIVKSCEVEFS